MFFQLLSTIKVNLVAKTMQKSYLCVLFHVKYKKIIISHGVNLVKSKMATIVGDVTGRLQQRHPPPALCHGWGMNLHVRLS